MNPQQDHNQFQANATTGYGRQISQAAFQVGIDESTIGGNANELEALGSRLNDTLDTLENRLFGPSPHAADLPTIGADGLAPTLRHARQRAETALNRLEAVLKRFG